MMKLRNIYRICSSNYKTIREVVATDVIINGRNGKRVRGWNSARRALEDLQKINSLREKVVIFLNSVPVFFIMEDSFEISTTEWEKIAKAKHNLLSTMENIIQLCEGMGIETEAKIGLDIKLPIYNDFSEYAKYINDIEFVLTKCPFLDVKDEKLEFNNVDVGSTWLTFFVAGGAVMAGSVLLNNIASFVDKCIIIRSHYLSVKNQKIQLENEKRKEQEKEIISKYIDELYKKEVDKAIEELEQITGYSVENKDGDERGRIEQCFNKMGSLIDKGLQIRSNIDSPKETQVLFEPLEMKYISVFDSLKLIDKNEESN